MTRTLKYLRIIGPIVLLGFPALVYAQASGLVPCGNVPFTSAGYLDPAYYINATGCNFCYLAQLIQRVVNFLVMVTIPISVAMFAWAGVRFFTSGGNLKRLASAKRIFRSVLIGFIVALSAWLVVQVTLQAVTDSNFYDVRNWSSLDCSVYNSQRARNYSINAVLTFVQPAPTTRTPTTPSSPTSPGTGVGGSGSLTQVNTTGPDGSIRTLPISATRSDADLAAAYDRVLSTYGNEITAACANSTIQNCKAAVVATIVAESDGNPNAISPSGARGLMQMLPTTANCSASNTQCQITEGVKYLTTQYNSFGNVPNALAAYNSGPATQPGAANGLNSAMVTSSSDPTKGCGATYYAWQCPTVPGGLVETQKYVANVCRTLQLKQQAGCGNI